MKRWTLRLVALTAALTLVAAPALAAQQTRSQDGTCADCTGDQTQTRMKDCGQVPDQTQTQARTGEAAQTQTKTQAQAGEPVQAQVKSGEPVQTQAQVKAQAGVDDVNHAPEWVQKMLRLKKQYAKRAHLIVSSD